MVCHDKVKYICCASHNTPCSCYSLIVNKCTVGMNSKLINLYTGTCTYNVLPFLVDKYKNESVWVCGIGVVCPFLYLFAWEQHFLSRFNKKWMSPWGLICMVRWGFDFLVVWTSASQHLFPAEFHTCLLPIASWIIIQPEFVAAWDDFTATFPSLFI